MQPLEEIPLPNDCPTVSICIPTRNRADLLSMQLRSILAQSFTNFEVIVCDNSDGSETEELIRQDFSDPRIRYFRNPTNLGMAGNARKALTLSRGRLVTFTPDDDLWIADDKLSRQVTAMDSFAAAAAFSSFLHIQADGQPHPIQFPNPPITQPEVIPIPSQELIPGQGSGRWTIGILTCMLSRDVLPVFVESWNFGSEELFMWWLGLSGQVVVFDTRPLVALRDYEHLWEVLDDTGRIRNFRTDPVLRGNNLIGAAVALRSMLPHSAQEGYLDLEQNVFRRVISLRRSRTLLDHRRFRNIGTLRKWQIVLAAAQDATLRRLRRRIRLGKG